jgi:hypothetical protein
VKPNIGRLVSGGQTGVDRAALDVALELGIACGGWCPLGRKAEDGTIPDRYPLTETPSPDLTQRTRWNVRDSDGSLVLSWGEPTAGTLETIDVCKTSETPFLVIDLAGEGDRAAAVNSARDWLAANLDGGTLNVAGPRAGKHPDIYDRAKAFLGAVLGD